MDILTIRSTTGRQRLLEVTPPPQSVLSAASEPSAASHRRWPVTITLNDRPPIRTTLIDPFLETQYNTVLERYLRNTDEEGWSPAPEQDRLIDASRLESLIKAYAETLLGQLDIKPSLLNGPLGLKTKGPQLSVLQINVVEECEAGAEAAEEGGIHCLAWEVLESVGLPRMPKIQLRVTRVVDITMSRSSRNIRQMRRSGNLHVPLSLVQADPGATFKILLVVARDFQRMGAQRDPEPDLAQFPLMTIQRKLRSRLLLEVVRPGSVEELERHLKQRAADGIQFNLVHFDLHGRIMEDEHGVPVPWLLFAQRQARFQRYTPKTPQVQFSKASVVADVLVEYRIENVVLNACLSAYNGTNSSANLSHIFLQRGIFNVSAMWYYVHWQTVATYLERFYVELLLKGTEFHAAAQAGRYEIRSRPTVSGGRLCKDHFICVNYTRESHWADGMDIGRDPSPAPSTSSNDSMMSATSMRSFKTASWRPSTPKLGDAQIASDEPVMRMKLHMLELEYKLFTYHIVYGSDLNRVESDMDISVENVIGMWMATNLLDEVCFYRGKDFARRALRSKSIPFRDRRSRSSGGYLQMLFPKPIKSLQTSTLHVVRDLDEVLDPGWQADDEENRKAEDRRLLAFDNLQRFAQQVHSEGSYMLILGKQDPQWWTRNLQFLDGVWWLALPWSLSINNR